MNAKNKKKDGEFENSKKKWEKKRSRRNGRNKEGEGEEKLERGRT